MGYTEDQYTPDIFLGDPIYAEPPMYSDNYYSNAMSSNSMSSNPMRTHDAVRARTESMHNRDPRRKYVAPLNISNFSHTPCTYEQMTGCTAHSGGSAQSYACNCGCKKNSGCTSACGTSTLDIASMDSRDLLILGLFIFIIFMNFMFYTTLQTLRHELVMHRGMSSMPAMPMT